MSGVSPAVVCLVFSPAPCAAQKSCRPRRVERRKHWFQTGGLDAPHRQKRSGNPCGLPDLLTVVPLKAAESNSKPPRAPLSRKAAAQRRKNFHRPPACAGGLRGEIASPLRLRNEFDDAPRANPPRGRQCPPAKARPCPTAFILRLFSDPPAARRGVQARCPELSAAARSHKSGSRPRGCGTQSRSG